MVGTASAMKAVTGRASRTCRSSTCPTRSIEQPTDIVVDITSTGLCGSDLHLYDPLSPFMTAGDIVGHEPMGIVREVGPAVETLQVGDRVVVPFNISCGSCWMCDRSCSASARRPRTATPAPARACSATASSTVRCPAVRPRCCGCRSATPCRSRCPHGPPDDRFLFLSDVLPTAWQAVEYADVQEGGTLLVVGAGPIGDMATRIGCTAGCASSRSTRCASAWRGSTAEAPSHRPHRARRHRDRVRDLTDGRGADAVIDAVGMEAHGSPVAETAQKALGLLPRRCRRR